MSHQTIVMRVGPTDTQAIAPSVAGSIVSQIEWLDMHGTPSFGVGAALRQLDEWGFVPTAAAVELLMLAAAITAADTRVSRKTHAQDGWSREIDLHLAVSDVDLWSAQSKLLRSILGFLTGDRWRVLFRPRPADAPQVVGPTQNLRLFEPTCVSLLSGGLDSYIGAIDLLHDAHEPIFVSHWWDPNASRHQSDCIEALSKHHGGRELHQVRGHVGFNHHTLNQSSSEDTLRGRSFLFFALASAAASAIGGPFTVYVPENGLISLNVPLDPLRVGALSTRTTHPYYMARFNELLAGVGISARLENPYRHQTKGEMVSGCKDLEFLRATAALTMSCSAEGKHRHDRDPTRRAVQHCGHCVPCLIRRASLRAGLGEDRTSYWLNPLEGQVIDSKKAVGEHIRAFQFALTRLAAQPTRAGRDIHQPGPLYDHPQDLAAYEGVYVRGMREVASLLENVQSRPLT